MREAIRGTTAILTRASDDNGPLARRLRGDGVRVIELPCVRTVPVADAAPFADALGRLGREDWIVVTSRAGADALARAARGVARVAAIGAATAARLRAHGIPVDFTPSVASGACLARELPAAHVALLARSDRALADLPRILRERGFEVREVVAYRAIVGAHGDVVSARDLLAGEAPGAIFFWSPSAVDGLLASIPRELVARADVFVTGDATRDTARDRLGPSARIRVIDEEVIHVTDR